MHFRCRVRKLFGFVWIIQCARVVFWCRNDIPSWNQPLFHSIEMCAFIGTNVCSRHDENLVCEMPTHCKCRLMRRLRAVILYRTYLRIQIPPANRTGTMSNDKDSARNGATCDTRAYSQHIIEPKMPCTFRARLRCWSRSRSHRDTTRLNGKSNQKRQKSVCIANENVNRIDGDGEGTSVCAPAASSLSTNTAQGNSPNFSICLHVYEWTKEIWNYFFLLFCCWIGFDELADRAATACIRVRSEMKE